MIALLFFTLTGEERGVINSINNTKKIFWHADTLSCKFTLTMSRKSRWIQTDNNQQ